MSKRIPLTQGKFALVDDEDFEWLNQWKWYAAKDTSRYYARRSVWENGKTREIQMHRIILNALLSMEPDHINGNGLDNRRSNLRSCTHSQNMMNQKKQAGGSSRHKGVSWDMRDRKWRAHIGLIGIRKHLGSFSDEIDAAMAYDAAAKKHFGAFARLNFPGRESDETV